MAVTLEELRELSLRSRRAQRWGFLAALILIMLYPAQILLAQWVPVPYAAVGALAIGAIPAVRFAYLAGAERGAFRRVFRRLADERRTRTIVPDGPAAHAERVIER